MQHRGSLGQAISARADQVKLQRASTRGKKGMPQQRSQSKGPPPSAAEQGTIQELLGQPILKDEI